MGITVVDITEAITDLDTLAAIIQAIMDSVGTTVEWASIILRMVTIHFIRTTTITPSITQLATGTTAMAVGCLPPGTQLSRRGLSVS